MADTTERLQEAIAIARAGNTSEALMLADELVQEDPNNPHALFLRGMLAESKEEQIEYMERVLAIEPEHKAASKRMAQLAPAPAEEVSEEVVEEAAVEEEPVEEFAEDATVIDGAIALDEAMEEAAPAEMEEVEETFSEDLEPEEAVEEVVEAEAGEAEVVMADTMLAEEPEEEDSGEVLEATLVGAAVLEETAFNEDELGQSDEIPDWLLSEARSEEELVEFDETALWGEEDIQEPAELPDWLQEEPADEWATGEALEVDEDEAETILAVEDIPEFEEVDEVEEFDEIAAAVAEPDGEPKEAEVVAPGPAKPKKSDSRGLEIFLYILIILAVLLVGGLAWVIISPPF